MSNKPINVSILPPKKIQITVKNSLDTVVVKEKKTTVVTVGIMGLQGASGANAPLSDEPVEVYLKARGVNPNGNNS